MHALGANSEAQTLAREGGRTARGSYPPPPSDVPSRASEHGIRVQAAERTAQQIMRYLNQDDDKPSASWLS